MSVNRKKDSGQKHASHHHHVHNMMDKGAGPIKVTARGKSVGHGKRGTRHFKNSKSLSHT